MTYRSTVHVSIPAARRERDVIRAVSARTQDDFAVLADLPSGRQQLGHAFPLPASFDALSAFEFTGSGGAHTALEAHLVYSNPLFFGPPEASSEPVDVVVIRLRGYHVHYVGDPQGSPIHLELEPLPGLMKRRTDLAFKDVYINPATFLPIRVTFVGADERSLAIDYTTIDGQWIVNRVSYTEALYPLGPIHIAHAILRVEAAFDQVRFYSFPPDNRLAPGMVPHT